MMRFTTPFPLRQLSDRLTSCKSTGPSRIWSVIYYPTQKDHNGKTLSNEILLISEKDAGWPLTGITLSQGNKAFNVSAGIIEIKMKDFPSPNLFHTRS